MRALLFALVLGCSEPPRPLVVRPTSATEDAGAIEDVTAPSAPAPKDAASEPPPTGGGKPGSNDQACEAPLAWWATSASFDPSVTPKDFATAVNPLLSNAHPITLASRTTPQWVLRASATLTNGSYQQYFPFDHAGDDGAMTRQQSSFSASPSTSFVAVTDASSALVWVPLVDVSVSATYGDAYCQTLTGGQLDATIPLGAGSTAIDVGAKTTLAALLGAPTTNKGWSARLLFSGQKVQVSWK